MVQHPYNSCNALWVLGNITVLLSVLLDFIGTSIGWRMFKILRESAGDDFQFGPMMNPGMGLGPHGPLGGPGADASRGGGQEMPPYEMRTPRGFTPFSGPGQS